MEETTRSVKSSSRQKPDSMDVKRFDTRKVTGSTEITNISSETAGTNTKLTIEKTKIMNRTR